MHNDAIMISGKMQFVFGDKREVNLQDKSEQLRLKKKVCEREKRWGLSIKKAEVYY